MTLRTSSFARAARRHGIRAASGLAAAGLLVGGGAVAQAAEPTYPSDSAKPDLVKLLSSFNDFWTSDGKTTVVDGSTVSTLEGHVNTDSSDAAKIRKANDDGVVAINNAASTDPTQLNRALRDNE